MLFRQLFWLDIQTPVLFCYSGNIIVLLFIQQCYFVIEATVFFCYSRNRLLSGSFNRFVFIYTDRSLSWKICFVILATYCFVIQAKELFCYLGNRFVLIFRQQICFNIQATDLFCYSGNKIVLFRQQFCFNIQLKDLFCYSGKRIVLLFRQQIWMFGLCPLVWDSPVLAWTGGNPLLVRLDDKKPTRDQVTNFFFFFFLQKNSIWVLKKDCHTLFFKSINHQRILDGYKTVFGWTWWCPTI